MIGGTMLRPVEKKVL